MCPKCREPLVIVEFQGVELDFCPACRGAWFDAGELEFICELAGADRRTLTELLATGIGRPGQHRCPRCRRRLEVATVGADPPVEVDRCPAADGVWLDAGELRALVGRQTPGRSTPLNDFLGELFRDHLATPREDT